MGSTTALIYSKLLSSLLKERVRFVLWMPVLLGVGIAWYFSLLREPSPWAGGAFLLLLAALMLRLREHGRWLFVLPLALVALGFTAAQFRTQQFAGPLLRETLSFRMVEGIIADMTVEEKGAGKLVLSRPAIEGLSPGETPHRVRVNLRTIEGLGIGDRIRVKATLHPLPQPVMPGGYDYARQLYFEGLGAVGYATSAVEVLERSAPSAWHAQLTQIRLSMAEAMLARMDAPAGSVAAALTVGEQQAIPDAVNDAMRASGLYHILSISGLHLALAAGIIFFTVRLLLSLHMGLALHLPVKKISALVALAGAFFYLLMAGGPVPAQRSFVMVAFVLLAVLCDRRGISLYALAWAAVGIVLVEPESLLGASFHMSFAATLAIVALHERHSARFSRRAHGLPTRILYYFLAVALTSLAATLATAPLVAHHFNRVQIWGVLANVLVAPLASFCIMPGVVITFLLWPLGLEGVGFTVMETGIRAMLWIARQVAALPYASMRVVSLTSWGFACVALGGLWMLLWRRHVRWLGVPLALLGMASLLFHRAPDVLVSADARQMMVRNAEGGYTLVKGSERAFAVRAWLDKLAQHQAETLQHSVSAADAGIDCASHTCHYRRGERMLTMITHWSDAKSACAENPAAVLALFYLRDGECDAARPRMDRALLARDGAAALYLEVSGIQVETVADARGKRPWVP